MTTEEINTESADRRESVSTRQGSNFEHQERIVEDLGAERRSITYRITRLIYLIFGVIESLIGLRILFKLIEANPNNLFAAFVYRLTDMFLKPFVGLITNPSAGRMVLEVTSLIALLVYSLVGWLIVQLVWLVFYRARTRTVTVYNKERQ
jgi:hypothetical protein